ncbi:recombinase family protein [Vibrio owensii]|uniref:recombinase family protein n=1 Tax=Vibrio owensii TaxID=696485 RepID=UPI0005974188|nr:recombinase family protein [Vibrio owensii]
MKTATALVRVSTSVQEHGHGLDRQDTDISAFLTANTDYKLERTIQAIGESAYSGVVHDDSSEFGAYLNNLESKRLTPPTALLISSLDRLTRLPFFEATELINRVLKLIPELIVCDTGKRYSLSGGQDLGSLMELSLKIQLAHEESLQKSKRLRAARLKRVDQIAKKEKVLNNRPFWIDWNGTDYVLNEYADTVRKMVELRLQGMGSVAIQAYLNERPEAYPCFMYRGTLRKWTKSRIDDILFKEKTITGTYVIKTTYTPDEKRAAKRDGVKLSAYNKDASHELKGLFPAIVDEVTYHKLKTGTGKGRVSNQYHNVLRSLGKCTCGSSFVLSYDSKVKTVEDRIYLKCNRRNQEGRLSECSNPSIKVYPLVRKILFQLLEQPLYVEDVNKVSKSDELQKQIEENEALLQRLQKRLELDLPESVLSDLVTRLKAVTDVTASLKLDYQTAIASESESVDTNTVLTNLRNLGLKTAEQRIEVNKALRSLLSEVVVNNETKRVLFKFKSGATRWFDYEKGGDVAEAYHFAFEQVSEADSDDFE